jgi:hypothetical protein
MPNQENELKKFITYGQFISEISIIVEADSEEEATKKALEIPHNEWDESGMEFQLGFTEDYDEPEGE